MNIGLGWLGLAVGALVVGLAGPVAAEPVDIDSLPHIHGIAFDPDDSTRVLLGTHQGVYRAAPDGVAERISDVDHDFMSFVPVPGTDGAFMGSGHPAGGGNLGLLGSTDGAKTWQHLSDGLGGPVDFHALTVSSADPKVIYGLYGALQVSRDGGKTFAKSGEVPQDTWTIVATKRSPDHLMAGARNGLWESEDGGRSWSLAYLLKRPAPALTTLPDGTVFAFVYSVGLMKTAAEKIHWTTVQRDFADRAIMQLAVDPKSPERMLAMADTGGLLISQDGGVTWTNYVGYTKQTPEIIAKGKRIYTEACQSCHGVNGVGERPDDMYAQDENGQVVAPPLDDSAHGWHHPDAQLSQFIHEGSPRNPRMIAWQDILSDEDIDALVAYIKSLWNFRSLACQGARHMQCMR